MDVLLINPPIRLTSEATVIPWGLTYVAQSLLDEGHRVSMLDINAYRWNREEVLNKISKLNFDLVGIGGLITTYSYLKWITLEIKKLYPDIPIIAGGYVASPIPKIIFSNTGVDVICYGEADLTVKELLVKLENGGNLDSVKGLYIKKNGEFNGEYIQTDPRPLIRNLDEIPIPKSAYKLLPMDIYLKNATVSNRSCLEAADWSRGLDISKTKTFALLSGRGCTNRCTFCYRMIKSVRKHSIGYVIEHLKHLKENYGATHFDFVDEHFTAIPKWTNEFCDILISENIDIHFRAWSRVDRIDRETLDKMRAAGCYWLGFGFESGSQKMLDAMNKGVDVKNNYKVAKLMKERNFNYGPTFIIGIPGEDKSSIDDTRKLIKTCKIEFAGVFFAAPYPGTKLYDFALKEGLIKDEEKFIEKLNDANASEFIINLTKLKDNILKKYYFMIRSEIIKNGISKLRDGSLKNELIFIIKALHFYLYRIIFLITYELGADDRARVALAYASNPLRVMRRIFAKLNALGKTFKSYFQP